MMRSLLSLVLLVASASAFAPAATVPRTMRLFAEEDSASPLEVVDSDAPFDPLSTTAAEDKPMTSVYKNLGKDGEIKEVQWVDPAMSANSDPFQLGWYSYPLILLPGILLLNDAFHFIPKDGPLSFLYNV